MYTDGPLNVDNKVDNDNQKTKWFPTQCVPFFEFSDRHKDKKNVIMIKIWIFSYCYAEKMSFVLI